MWSTSHIHQVTVSHFSHQWKQEKVHHTSLSIVTYRPKFWPKWRYLHQPSSPLWLTLVNAADRWLPKPPSLSPSPLGMGARKGTGKGNRLQTGGRVGNQKKTTPENFMPNKVPMIMYSHIQITPNRILGDFSFSVTETLLFEFNMLQTF